MSPATFQRTLKQNVNRTVRLSCWEEEGRLVGHIIKRFHGASAARRLFDGRRARREWRALAAVRERGLPTPRPIELRQAGGHWELVTELLAGAVPLRLLLTGFAPCAVPRGRLATGLGELFADVARRGLQHPDLHAGNLLVDEAGKPWLIDLAKARLGPALQPGVIEDLLVQLAADVRETSSSRDRARFLIAAWRALPLAQRPGTSRSALAARVEERARLERRRVVHRAEERWSRRSSATRPFQNGTLSGFLRQDLSDEVAVSAVAALGPHANEARTGGRRFLAFRADSYADVRSQWYASARLAMHSVPCARPAVLVRAPEALALFELPMEARPAPNSEGEQAGLLAVLRDRGLTVRELSGEHLYLCGPGLVLGVGFELSDLSSRESARD